MSQTKGKTVGTSIQDAAFSSTEKQILQNILDKPYWARRQLKNNFAKKFGRQIEDVDNYIKANGKLKNKKGNKAKKERLAEPLPIKSPDIIIDHSEPIRTNEGSKPASKAVNKAEFRVKFTNLRIEDDALIFEIVLPG